MSNILELKKNYRKKSTKTLKKLGTIEKGMVETKHTMKTVNLIKTVLKVQCTAIISALQRKNLA